MPTLEAVPAPADTNLSLEQRRVIRAPRARVYEAWTNPELLKQWFGGCSDKYCPSATLDVHVGGRYRIESATRPEIVAEKPELAGRVSAATGEYTEVVPGERLVFTWSPSWSPEELSLVTISFHDVPLGTEVTIRHERFLTEASRDAHSQGWAGCLEKMATLLEA